MLRRHPPRGRPHRAGSGEGVPATVYVTEPLGGETVVDLQLGDRIVKALAPPTLDLETDEEVAIRLDAAADPPLRRGGRRRPLRRRRRRRLRRLFRMSRRR